MATRQIAGEIGELYVFSELLKRGAIPFLPLVDEGVDALVRTPDGAVVELQVKSPGSARGKYPRWFQMASISPRRSFFIVGGYREILDDNDYQQVPIMGYAAKYASAFYGPFRVAADSTPQFGDRRSYQMDPANSRMAMRELFSNVRRETPAWLSSPQGRNV